MKTITEALCATLAEADDEVLESFFNLTRDFVSSLAFDLPGLDLAREHHGKTVHLPHLDALLQSVGCRLAAVKPEGKRATPGDITDIIIGTEFYRFGGHTRVVEDLVGITGAGTLTVATDINGTYGRGEGFVPVEPKKFAFLSHPGVLAKVKSLINLLHALRPERIWIVAHHHDVVAYTACCSALGGRQIYLHHADHNPTLGATVAHYEHVDFLYPVGDIGELCREIGGVDPILVPLAGRPPRRRESPGPGRKRLVTACSGSESKFSFTGGDLFYPEIVRALLGAGVERHVHIGLLRREYLDAIHAALKRHGIDPKRFCHIPVTDNLTEALAREAVDVYVGSAPTGGGKALLEAMSYGVPCLVFSPQSGRTPFLLDRFLIPALTWSGSTELVACLGAVKENYGDYARSVRELYQSHFSPKAFEAAIRGIVSGHRPPHSQPSSAARCDEDTIALAIGYARLFHKRVVGPFLRQLDEKAESDGDRYQSWLRRHSPGEGEIAWRLQQVQEKPDRPGFHFILPLEDGKQSALADTLDSLAAQCYGHWRLSVVSQLPCPDPLFDELPQLRWHRVQEPATLADALNTVSAAVESDWIGILRPGDRLVSFALLSLAEAIQARPDWRLIYSDEGRISPDGVLHSPRFKPDFNLDLLRADHYLGGFVVRREVLEQLGGFAALSGAEEYDLALRLLEKWGEEGFGHLPEVLLHRPDARPSPGTAAETEAVRRHLARCGIPAEVEAGPLPGTRRIRYPLTATPRVSILVPTRDRLDLLQPCLESILGKTRYPDFEVLVIDNQSQAEQTRQYLDRLAARDGRVRVLPYPHAYNFAAINNIAAEAASGEFLLLLNNDTVVLHEDWLERLVCHGLRPEVGAVGARLVYPDGTIQHAGVILGMGAYGVAEHWHLGQPLDATGYMGRLQLVQNLSAVTAACLLVRKSLYLELGGLNAGRYKVLYNDIDFCLRLRERGHLIVWTPEVTVLHHGSGSLRHERDPQGNRRAMDEVRAMLDDWLPALARDPAYNPNLSLINRTPVMETGVDVPWTHPAPRGLKVVGMPLDNFGIGEYRMAAPLRQLTATGRISSRLLPPHVGRPQPLVMSVTEMARAAPEVVFLHEALTDSLINVWETYRRYTEAFLVYSQDDLVFQLPPQHPLAKTRKDYKKRLRKMLHLSDRLIVGTQPMAEAFADMIDDICVVPNRLEWARWGHIESRRRRGSRPRVGWAGGIQHQGDLMFLLPVLEATAGEVDWVFFGMCPDVLRPHVTEFHPGVPFDAYPEKLAGLHLDLAVAPLERNNYNEAKSNLRLLEYGILGWPVICTDIYPYQNQDPPVCRLPNRPELWVKAIRERVHEPDALEQEGMRLREWVRQAWILEDHLDEWLAALTPTR